MENIYGDGCPVAEIMDRINACVCECSEIAGNDDLDCVDFLIHLLDDMTDPVALAEAISAGESVNHFKGKSTSNCGLGGARGSFGRASSDAGCVQLNMTLE
jgi:hypothetical protein